MADGGRVYAASSENDRPFVESAKTILPPQGEAATIASASFRVEMELVMQWGQRGRRESAR